MTNRTVSCRACGRENPANNVYCGACGVKLGISTSAHTTTPYRSHRRKWKQWLWGLAATAAAVAVFVLVNPFSSPPDFEGRWVDVGRPAWTVDIVRSGTRYTVTDEDGLTLGADLEGSELHTDPFLGTTGVLRLEGDILVLTGMGETRRFRRGEPNVGNVFACIAGVDTTGEQAECLTECGSTDTCYERAALALWDECPEPARTGDCYDYCTDMLGVAIANDDNTEIPPRSVHSEASGFCERR